MALPNVFELWGETKETIGLPQWGHPAYKLTPPEMIFVMAYILGMARADGTINELVSERLSLDLRDTIKVFADAKENANIVAEENS